jgi:hypothetical protein
VAVRAPVRTARLTRARVASLVSPRVALPLAFAFSALWLAWQASHVSSYIWLIDELLYVKNGVSYGDLEALRPHVHGEPHGVPNVLFPLLIAPLYGLLSSPAAFEGAHILNGVLWATTLFPVYLLTRRLGASWPWALLAGLLTVWVPWSVATLVMMTEATTYAVFPWALLAMTLAIARPRPRHDVLAVVAIAVSAAARTQMVFLFVVLVLAIVAFELSDPHRAPLRERLRRRWALVAMLGGGLAVLGLISLAGGQPLGGYEVTAGLERFPGGLWGSAVSHAAHIVVGLGILVPILYLTWTASVAFGPDRPMERAFAIVGAITLVLLFYQAAFFAQLVAASMQERYVSYAVPILVVGAVLLAADLRRRAPRLSVLAAGMAVAGVIAGAPFTVAEAATAFDWVANPGAAVNQPIERHVGTLTRWFPGRDLKTNEGLVLIAAVLSLLAAVAFNTRVRRFALPALLAGTLVFTAAETRWLHPRVITGIGGAFPGVLPGVRLQDPDWVDDAVGQDATVGLVGGRLEEPVLDHANQWMWHEFWNESVRREYTEEGRSRFTGWPAINWSVDRSTGRVAVAEVPDAFLVAPKDPIVRFRGRVVRRGADTAEILVPARPLQAEWQTDGLKWEGVPKDPEERTVTLRLFTRDRVTILMKGDSMPEGQQPRRLRYEVADAGGRRRLGVDPGVTAHIPVEGVRSGGGPAIVRITLTETVLDDGARLTVRFIGVTP